MLDFIYAKELKKKFTVSGRFYDLKLSGKRYECRSHLEIRSLSTTQHLPDAVVVMMNPGSSEPLDKAYEPPEYDADTYLRARWELELVPTRPDNAQYQIMRLMLVRNWNMVRVLNLSDLRDGDSGSFGNVFDQANLTDPRNPHCITSERRRPELISSLNTCTGGVVVAAWGTKSQLDNSARSFLDCHPQAIGIELPRPWYRYASPRQKRFKLDWLDEINKVIEKHNNAIN